VINTVLGNLGKFGEMNKTLKMFLAGFENVGTMGSLLRRATINGVSIKDMTQAAEAVTSVDSKAPPPGYLPAWNIYLVVYEFQDGKKKISIGHTRNMTKQRAFEHLRQWNAAKAEKPKIAKSYRMVKGAVYQKFFLLWTADRQSVEEELVRLFEMTCQFLFGAVRVTTKDDQKEDDVIETMGDDDSEEAPEAVPQTTGPKKFNLKIHFRNSATLLFQVARISKTVFGQSGTKWKSNLGYNVSGLCFSNPLMETGQNAKLQWYKLPSIDPNYTQWVNRPSTVPVSAGPYMRQVYIGGNQNCSESMHMDGTKPQRQYRLAYNMPISVGTKYFVVYEYSHAGPHPFACATMQDIGCWSDWEIALRIGILFLWKENGAWVGMYHRLHNQQATAELGGEWGARNPYRDFLALARGLTQRQPAKLRWWDLQFNFDINEVSGR